MRQRHKPAPLTFEPIPAGSGQTFAVTADRVLLGFVQRLPAERGFIHPWKAFAPQFRPGQRPCLGVMIAAEIDDTREQAAERLRS